MNPNDPEFPGFENVFEHFGEAVGAPVDRRRFLQLMGASLGLMGLTGVTGCRRPDVRVLPYSRPPDDVVPGMPLYYATSIPRAGGCYPILVESHEGRPTKIEGNPRHPVSQGSSDLQAQASVLDLYDPDRMRNVRRGEEPSDWQTFDAFATKHFADLLANRGRGLRFLSEDLPSPAMRMLREQLVAAAPEAVWHTHDPLHQDGVRAGAKLAFGEALEPSYRFDLADVVLALDADFLGDHPDAVRHAREFGKRRSGEAMNRLYVIENTFTITGSMADHRLGMPLTHITDYLLALCEHVLKLLGMKGSALGGIHVKGATAHSRHSAPQPWIDAVGEDLVAKRGHGIVLVGPRQPALVHALAHLLNEVLGNHRTTVSFRRGAERTAGLAELTDAINRSAVHTLVILGGNPAVDAPADLNFSDLLNRVPHTIRLGMHEDETTALCEWRLPAAHYLESWGDAESANGTYAVVQPLIAPLYGGRSALELVARLIRYETTDSYEIVLRSFRQRAGTADQRAFRKFLHEGFRPDTESETVRPAPAWKALAAALADYRPAPPVGSENLELSFHADYRMRDGRYANNGWLQETPDPITKLTWGNAVCVSPETARQLKLATGDLVALSLGGRTIKQIAVYILPGQANNSLSVHLGYGRTRCGSVGRGHGFDVYPLRTSSAPWFASGLTVGTLGRRHVLATTQEHSRMEGRPLVQIQNVGAATERKSELRHLPVLDLAAPAKLDGGHQWGMAIDLSACNGCSACVVACQSENNIPIVGKDEVTRHRAMHWLRLDRYFIDGEDEESTTIAHQPVMCQHCESAPCEPVCPVNASVHSPEGLNLQVYNRCVGTRYCANNCPYKTRRFNWFDYNQRPLDALRLGPLTEKGMADTLQMQKNPDVTVRMRGVMEKCTLCVQRIERGKAGAKLADPDSAGPWPVPDGTIVSACAQACPAQAIVFGNVADPKSRVSKLKEEQRNYRLLDELNTKPRVSYLARRRNPNPAMPAAEVRA